MLVICSLRLVVRTLASHAGNSGSNPLGSAILVRSGQAKATNHSMPTAANKQTDRPAGLLVRLLAMFYDSLLLFSALMIATALALLVAQGTLNYHNPFFRTFLFLVCFSF